LGLSDRLRVEEGYPNLYLGEGLLFAELDAVNFGVVGLGVIGEIHARNVAELESTRLVAVVDQVRERAESVGRALGAEHYKSIDEALKNVEIEAVIIATPSYLHAPQALFALLHDKHVLVEKPMATTLSGARLISRTAEERGLRLGVVFQERYMDAAVRLKELIDSGALGRLLLLEGELKWWRGEEDYYRKDLLARSWRGYWETEGGGVLMNQAIHTVDLLLWLGGEASLVAGMASNQAHPSVEVEDTVMALIEFRNGAQGCLVATVCTPPETSHYREVRVVGTKGQARLRDYSLKASTVNGEVSVGGEVRFGELHRRLLDDFAKSLRSGRRFKVDGAEGYKSLELVKAIYRSGESRFYVSLPLEVSGE
jgi:UDP-N-acetyl-2-amino-2-deoxyglucuronate dehydrogenase